MQVSRGAYSAWAAKKTYQPNEWREKLSAQIKASFYRHRQRYGARRIKAELNAAGVQVGRRLIGAVLKREGLRAIQPKRFVPRTTDSTHGSLASPNLLKDTAHQPASRTEVIVGDITYLPLSNGQWCYLAIWQDRFTRRIVGWAVSERMTDELVIAALKKALLGGLVKPGTIIHSDRGSQYVSRSFRALLEANKLRQSMSGKGNCYDNAQAESFFSRFKTELVEDGLFESVQQARGESFDYIEGYYNRIRRHSSLGYKSPLEFERELKTKEKGQSVSFMS